MMKLSAKYASKFGHYNVTVHGTSVKVRVVDNSDVVSLGLLEFKSIMGKNKIVGITAYCGNVRFSTIQMIVLCVNSHCLVIQVCRLEYIPGCLNDFLKDREICFVGPDMKTTLSQLSEYENRYVKCLSCPGGMDVGDLAAKSLLDPTLLSNKRTASKKIAECIHDIADKVGVTLEKITIDITSIDLAALAFSHDQIKCLVADVCASYLIAAKILI